MEEVGSYTGPLGALIKELNPKKGLEIGFGWYGYSAHTYLDNCEGTLTSVDKQDWRGEAEKLAKENHRFSFLKRRSEHMLRNWKMTYDYIYIDGDHRYEGSLNDMRLCAPLVEIGGFIVLDDCDYDLTQGLNLDDSGQVLNGPFGVGKAADEVFDNNDWGKITPPLPLANGGRVYERFR